MPSEPVCTVSTNKVAPGSVYAVRGHTVAIRVELANLDHLVLLLPKSSTEAGHGSFRYSAASTTTRLNEGDRMSGADRPGAAVEGKLSAAM